MTERLKPSGRRSARSLNADEHALWSHVTRAVTRLRSAAPTTPAPSEADQGAQAPPRHSLSLAKSSPPQTPAPAPKEQPLAFDRKLKQRLARGHETIDRRIDLHGLNQEQAHGALVRFLRDARAKGVRTVLVITGKGSARGTDWDDERGVLRRHVPLWLKSPQLRDCVAGYEVAHIGHGGEGALYVRIRRERTRHEGRS
jgi:DNA-nicking Smr family endonuclease